MSDEVRELKYKPILNILDFVEIHDLFHYHAPSAEGVERHAELSREFERLALLIEATVPGGREKSIVFTKLEEAKMWASAGVARNPKTR